MTLAEALEPARRTRVLAAAAGLAALAAALYGPVLRDLAVQWWTDPDYGHGLFVPFFAAYAAWQERGHYARTPVAPSNLGLPVICLALVLLVGGRLGAELFTARFSLVLLLAGIVLYAAGGKLLRAAAFPLGFLVLGIPLPAIVYNEIIFPLQLVASRLGAGVLEGMGIPVLREGNLLTIPGYQVEVVQACSGIRSLLSLTTITVAYLYLAEKRWGLRLAMIALVVPVAVVSNALRIVGTSLIGYRFGQEYAEGFLHLFSGWLIFLSATVLMLAAHGVLKRMAKSDQRLAAER